jgi:hypothetical protein
MEIKWQGKADISKQDPPKSDEHAYEKKRGQHSDPAEYREQGIFHGDWVGWITSRSVRRRDLVNQRLLVPTVLVVSVRVPVVTALVRRSVARIRAAFHSFPG